MAQQRRRPGWVPTRTGGPGAPDDLRLGHLTQEWLATSARQSSDIERRSPTGRSVSGKASEPVSTHHSITS
jgi:hypothetical protein